MDLILTSSLAIVFYQIGNIDYGNKGWMLAPVSVIMSIVGCEFLGILGLFGANLLLYLALFIYNLLVERPPSSRSGF